MTSPYSPTGLDQKSGSYEYRKGGYRDVYVDNSVVVDEDDEIIEPVKKKRTGWIIFWVILGIVILIIVILLLYFFVFKKSSTSSSGSNGGSGTSTDASLGQSCVTAACFPPLLCQQDICKSPFNGACPQGNGQCATGYVCSGNQCKVQYGGTCSLPSDCAAGYTCTSAGICS
jgi:hypothetical protein